MTITIHVHFRRKSPNFNLAHERIEHTATQCACALWKLRRNRENEYFRFVTEKTKKHIRKCGDINRLKLKPSPYDMDVCCVFGGPSRLHRLAQRKRKKKI